jgi:hypothetical protein
MFTPLKRLFQNDRRNCSAENKLSDPKATREWGRGNPTYSKFQITSREFRAFAAVIRARTELPPNAETHPEK